MHLIFFLYALSVYFTCNRGRRAECNDTEEDFVMAIENAKQFMEKV